MKIKNENGASIVAVIIILSILAILGAVFVSIFDIGVEESTGEATSMRAFYIAEAGAETAVGRLKKTPAGSNWTWNDGYLNKSIGSGAFNVEVLEYENMDSTLAAAYACEPFQSVVKATGANPAKTVLVTLSWSAASNMNLELYDNAVASCANPTASANLIDSDASAALQEPKTVRYRVQTAPPATLTYTARVTGTVGDAYQLRISHPDETNFSSGNTCSQPVGPPNKACMRGLISLGKSNDARRELFEALSK